MKEETIKRIKELIKSELSPQQIYLKIVDEKIGARKTNVLQYIRELRNITITEEKRKKHIPTKYRQEKKPHLVFSVYSVLPQHDQIDFSFHFPFSKKILKKMIKEEMKKQEGVVSKYYFLKITYLEDEKLAKNLIKQLNLDKQYIFKHYIPIMREQEILQTIYFLVTNYQVGKSWINNLVISAEVSSNTKYQKFVEELIKNDI